MVHKAQNYFSVKIICWNDYLCHFYQSKIGHNSHFGRFLGNLSVITTIFISKKEFDYISISTQVNNLFKSSSIMCSFQSWHVSLESPHLALNKVFLTNSVKLKQFYLGPQKNIYEGALRNFQLLMQNPTS